MARRLSVSDVAERLDLSTDTVRRLADTGRLPYTLTPGGWRRFEPSDVEALQAELAAARVEQS